MTPTINSQVRYPVEVYEALKERAYRERKSANSLVVEAVKQLLNTKEKEEHKHERVTDL